MYVNCQGENLVRDQMTPEYIAPQKAQGTRQGKLGMGCQYIIGLTLAAGT